MRSLAHHLSPKVFIGKNKITTGVLSSISDAFHNEELIKIRLNSKINSDEIIDDISKEIKCQVVGKIGNIIIVYKKHIDPDKIKIQLPNK